MGHGFSIQSSFGLGHQRSQRKRPTGHASGASKAVQLRFAHFVRRNGIELIDHWLELGRPGLLWQEGFLQMLQDVVPTLPNEAALDYLDFWMLWKGNDRRWADQHAAVEEDKKYDSNASRGDGGDVQAPLRPSLANWGGPGPDVEVVEMYQFVSAVCLILPLDVYSRMRTFVRIYNLENHEGLTPTEFFLLLLRVLEGYSVLCGVELLVSQDQVESLQHALMSSLGMDEEQFLKDGRCQSVENYIPGVMPLLRSLGQAVAAKSRAIGTLSSDATACRDDLFPEMRVNSLFMGRYRVNEKLRSKTLQYFKRVTFKVLDEIERKKLAIKVLIPSDSDPPQHARNFLREAALLTRVKHPGLVAVSSYGQTTDFLFQIMDLLEGRTLKSHLDRLRARKPRRPGLGGAVQQDAGARSLQDVEEREAAREPSLSRPRPSRASAMEAQEAADAATSAGVPEVDIIAMLLGILQVLDRTHKQGIVHTNITPYAVFLAGGSFDDVKLLAWDMAKWDAESLGASSPLLTPYPEIEEERDPHYLSPEHCESLAEAPLPTWDIYSLGVVAFEAVTLQVPFEGLSLLRPDLLQGNRISLQPLHPDAANVRPRSSLRGVTTLPPSAILRRSVTVGQEPSLQNLPCGNLTTKAAVLSTRNSQQLGSVDQPFVPVASVASLSTVGSAKSTTSMTEPPQHHFLPPVPDNPWRLTAKRNSFEFPFWLQRLLALVEVSPDGTASSKTEAVPASALDMTEAEQALSGFSLAAQVAAIRREHIEMAPPDSREFFTSNDFIDILERMLEKNPEDRYLDGTVLVKDLMRLRGQLEELPRKMQACLPHLSYRVSIDRSTLLSSSEDLASTEPPVTKTVSEPDSPEAPGAVEKLASGAGAPASGGQPASPKRLGLDLRSEVCDDFCSRYLAKFATALTVDELRVTGDRIPLHRIRDPETSELDLSGRQLASHDCMVLARTFDLVENLRVLDLSNNAIAYETAVLASTQQHLQHAERASVESISAKRAEPQDEVHYELSGLQSIAEAVSSMRRLVSLDLSGNSLGGEGGAMVCRAVASCRSLEKFRLGFCDIMTPGGLALADSIRTMPRLTFLDLSHCHIGDVGAIAVARSLTHFEEQSCRLENLSLFANHITDEGGTALMSALESNFDLLALSLGDNKVPDVHVRVIQRAISFNNQYKSLKLRNDKFEGFGHNLMAESLRTWAKGDMFIAQRLLFRLRRPRDALEESVAQILLAPNRMSVVLGGAPTEWNSENLLTKKGGAPGAGTSPEEVPHPGPGGTEGHGQGSSALTDHLPAAINAEPGSEVREDQKDRVRAEDGSEESEAASRGEGLMAAPEEADAEGTTLQRPPLLDMDQINDDVFGEMDSITLSAQASAVSMDSSLSYASQASAQKVSAPKGNVAEDSSIGMPDSG